MEVRMPRHRTQLLLDPDQYETIVHLAEAQHRSISEIVREFIALGLRQLHEARERRLEALTKLGKLRKSIEAGADGHSLGDPVGEARAERQLQVDAVLFPEERL
jgi:hypothetical protein